MGTSKRNQWDNRPNKIAKGITKNEVRHKNRGKVREIFNDKDSIVRTLGVRGTLDEIGRFWPFRTMTVTVEHPVDKGYFKKVKRLNDKGRTALKWARRRRDKRLQEKNQNKFGSLDFSSYLRV